MVTLATRSTWQPVFQLDRYQSGIDHSLIDLESGMVKLVFADTTFQFDSFELERGRIQP